MTENTEQNSDLPRPIEFDQIQVGDEVRRDHGGVFSTFTVARRDGYSLRSTHAEHPIAILNRGTWTLLARSEPEPLVPTEPTLGVLTVRSGGRIVGKFKGFPSGAANMVDEGGLAQVTGFGPESIESFTPLTIQPTGTTAVPNEHIAAFREAVAARPGIHTKDSAIGRAHAMLADIDAREAGEQS